MPLLKVDNLKLYFQTEKGLNSVISNINFFINPAETLALVGESGCGKTMTALSIMQLLPPAARIDEQSKIFLNKRDLLSLSEYEMQKVRGRQVGMIFQEAMTAFDPVFTIGNQIDEILRQHFDLTANERQERILNLLEEVGLKSPRRLLKAYPHQLSGGMRQRAMIAMALAGQPQLLIADEPTTALDVTLQKKIIELLKRLQTKHQMSLLFITHDLALVAEIADRIAVMRKGKIVEQNTIKDFYAAPQTQYAKKLFAAIPSWEKRTKPPTKKVSSTTLQVKKLKVYFPIKKGLFKRTVGYIKAVDNINLNLYSNHTLALIGESGSGKTTTGKAIVRLIRPTSGEIYLDNNNLNELSDRKLRKIRSQLQMVFQDPFSSLDPRMLINDILEEGMLAQGIDNKLQRQKKIDFLLKKVGLEPEMKWRYPHEFSGGQRQRICIARCLTLNPKVLICDEPTSSLDVSVQLQILQLLKKIQQELHLSYLLITHNFSVIAYMADEVAVMYKGKIIEQGDVKKILFSPQHDYTKKLLTAVPKIPAEKVL